MLIDDVTTNYPESQNLTFPFKVAPLSFSLIIMTLCFHEWFVMFFTFKITKSYVNVTSKSQTIVFCS